jgi:succinate-semialdehyde dehydrogenase/glutarate-semialdehyde dehydrogenase
MPHDYQIYIAGQWCDSASGKRSEVFSPANGELIGTVPEGSREDVARAVPAAHAASRVWARRSAFEHAAALERVAQIIAERRDDLAYTLTLDQGKPLQAEAYAEVDDIVAYFRMAAAEAQRIDGILPPSIDANKRVLLQRVPRGVIGLITPWNWPYEMPAEVIAPALAAGNAVVWAAAPTTSICAIKLAECLAAADLPPGLLNLITGPGPVVGDEIAVHPGIQTVAFIGSVATGHRVAERAAGKDLLIEMGGNGPLVILEDADIEKAVAATLVSCLLCAGQSCSAGELILVQEQIHDAYVERLLQAIREGVRLGNPFDAATTLGPLNNEPTAAKMDRHIADALGQGAKLLYGGARAKGFPTSLYYEPTVLDGVTLDMQVAREETFGPIIPIATITHEDQALELVERSEYGLLSAIFTRDLRRALRFAEEVHTGWVNVNESTNWWEIHLPFGGRAGSRSGFGRVGGRFSIERMTDLKTIVIDLS